MPRTAFAAMVVPLVICGCTTSHKFHQDADQDATLDTVVSDTSPDTGERWPKNPRSLISRL